MSDQLKINPYPDLTVNGRLFPSWVLKNFRKYKLPDIIRKEGEDPCASKESKQELRTYQQFISQYLDFKSVYKNILVYHGLGSGKTATAINVYNALYNYTPGWNVFILLKAALRGGWQKDIKRWLNEDEYKFRFDNIIFINIDSPFADRNFLDEVKKSDSSKKSMYIIDEVHNFIKNVYSNISTNEGKRAQVIYDHIIQNKKDDPETRVVLLSATPAINVPFEMALMFNLLRPGLFPTREAEFNQIFVTEAGYQTLNKNAKNMFQRRILGLVSYYVGGTPDLYASKIVHYINVPMSEYQQQIYNVFEDIEEKINRNARLQGKIGSDLYKSYTRQASNFVFPHISQRITGESRPRPGKFRITENEATRIMEADTKESVGKIGKVGKVDVTGKVMKTDEYNTAVASFINGFEGYLFKIDSNDRDLKHTILDDYGTYKTKFEGDYDLFFKDTGKRSELYKAMYTCSAKMIRIIFTVMNAPGPCLVYSNHVKGEGLEIFKIYLKFFGFYNYMKSKKLKPDRIGYVEFHGDIKNQDDRMEGLRAFNDKANKKGDLLRIILISSAGAEGLNLINVRQVHIMEPWWNEVRVNQMIGRAIRLCSHKDLNMEDRVVDVFRYKSVRATGDKMSTDQYIESRAKTKDSLLQSFLDAIKEASVDCVLNKNHNKLVQEFKCFQFDEKSLFERQIGPAYKDNIYDDMRINNGSNSTTSTTMKIKVMEIKAVIKLSGGETVEAGEEDMYSKSVKYWYYDGSNTVYDYELHFPVGKVAVDENMIPEKLDKDTYIIDKIIQIPLIK